MQTQHAEELQDDIYTLQGRLKTLVVTTTIGSRDRLRDSDMLGALDDKSAILEVLAHKIFTGIKNIEVEMLTCCITEIKKVISRLSDP
jgi:hypothetical protein